MGARDDGRASRRWEARLDRPPDLEKLGREQHVEGARNGEEREDRLALVTVSGVAAVEHLDQVRRRAGPLGHPGNGGALGLQALEQGGVDDPFRQHAAALAPDGRDQDRDEAVALGHVVQAPASAPMTRARTRPTIRSHHVGWVIVLTS